LTVLIVTKALSESFRLKLLRQGIIYLRIFLFLSPDILPGNSGQLNDTKFIKFSTNEHGRIPSVNFHSCITKT